MDYFNYAFGQLYAEQVPIIDIVKEVGTPCYIYSEATLQRHYHVFHEEFKQQRHHICYAVKANSNLALLQLLAREGSWFDIVSVGELERVLRVGAPAQHIVFSGVGKRVDEIMRALEVGIFCFNVESMAELNRIQECAKHVQKKARISLRVNPDIDPKTHPYISTGLKENKFGISADEVIATYEYAHKLEHIEIVGIGCHIGSQILQLEPFQQAMQRLVAFFNQLKQKNIAITHLDIGGGLAVRYGDEDPPSVADYAQTILNELKPLKNENISLLLEPGRALVGNAGILVTTIEYLKCTKQKNFAIVDAGMNDLMRPALYEAWQNIIPVLDPTEVDEQAREEKDYDIVGPICETGDFLARERSLQLQQGDIIAIRTAGAYGFCMSSQYNSRPRCVEVLVSGTKLHVIRKRETMEDLWRNEVLVQ